MRGGHFLRRWFGCTRLGARVAEALGMSCGSAGDTGIRWKECDSPRQRARTGSLQFPALMDETRCRGIRVVLVQVRYDRREGRMRRLCAWATPGNGGEDPLGRRRKNATPVHVGM